MPGTGHCIKGGHPMPWNSVGSLIVGNSWQFTSPFPTQQQMVIRVTPPNFFAPSLGCSLTVRRDNGLWHLEPKSIVVYPNVIQVFVFPSLPTGLVSFNQQIAIRFSRRSPTPISVALAYWTN